MLKTAYDLFEVLVTAFTEHEFATRINQCEIEIAKAEDYGKAPIALSALRARFIKQEDEYRKRCREDSESALREAAKKCKQ